MTTPNPAEPPPPDPPDETAGQDERNRAAPPFPIVGIGASAGGLEAVRNLLQNLPDDTGMAFVYIQHLDPRTVSRLPEILGNTARLPVMQVVDGVAVRPDNFYIIPPNTTLTIADGSLHLEPRGPATPHLPIDTFFKSLAHDRGPGAIGVVLSGTDADGSLGIEEIKAAGGITIAQDERSAKFPGMPHNAVRSGAIDLVLPPDQIAQELTRIGHHPYLDGQAGDRHDEAEQFRRILGILRTASGVDFSGYRDSTIKRRMLRRTVLHCKNTLADYADFLERNPAEAEALYHDILINVTSFFRDPETFEALKAQVFPELVKGRDSNSPIRVWIPGCSTGQESYSLAIALLEFLESAAVRPPIQVFATDLSDTVSLKRAREGVYPKSIEAEVSPERLRRFFTKLDDKYRINKPVRDMCVFAKQNVASDPPFSRVDLVSCRNLLIYLSPALQRRVIPIFHYALNPVGYLMLGPAETVGGFTDLFGIVDARHRIYVRKVNSGRLYPHFAPQAYHPLAPAIPRTAIATAPDWQREADRIALGQYAPPGVLVNSDLDILQFRGRTGPYLQPPAGEPNLNLMRMAREGLMPELRKLLDACRQQGAAVSRAGLRIHDDDRVREVNLRVLPITRPGTPEQCFLIQFEEEGRLRRAGTEPRAAEGPVPSHAPSEASPFTALFNWIRRIFRARPLPDPPSPEALEVDRLRNELLSTREYLQTTAEQYDAANEELKSANEEILSSNEELQSTNEELETAKEELQSVNEELTTVNEQYQLRNQELTRVYDDLTNLIGSANIPMVLLGIEHRIRRFTPAAAKTLGLLPGDAGRPISNIKLPVEVPDLERIVSDVIAEVRTVEREVRDANGRWHLLRIHPYRTADNKIDGAVIVLVDIHEAKNAGLRLHEALEYARGIVETVRDPLLVLDGDLRIRTANRAYYRAFQTTAEATEGHLLYEIGRGEWNLPELHKQLDEVLPDKTAIDNFEVLVNFPVLGARPLLLNARLILREANEATLILLAIEDVTERRGTEESLRASEERIRLLVENVEDYAIFFLDPSGNIVSWDRGSMTALGYATDEIVGRPLGQLYTPEDRTRRLPERELERAAREGRTADENWLLRKDASRFWGSGATTALRDERGKLRGFVKIVQDSTERKHIADALRDSERRLRIALTAAQMGTWHWLIPADEHRMDPNLARLVDGPPGEVVQTLDAFLQRIHAEDRDRVRQAFERSMREGIPILTEFRVPLPDGSVRWLRDQGDVFKDDDGNPLFMSGACVDITALKTAEEDLRHARDELEARVRERTRELSVANSELESQMRLRQELSRKLVTSSEDQRRRISRELHDEMGQHLTALILSLKNLEGKTTAPEPLQKLQEIANQIGQDIHRIALELRPTALDDFGLDAAVQNYVDDWAKRSGIATELHGPNLGGKRLSPEIETTVYRIVQEALTNVLKHASATRVSIVVELRNDRLLVMVEDNGKGFDPDAVESQRSRDQRMGLDSIKERAMLGGGVAEIESAPDKGTTVIARLPVGS